MTTQLPGEHRSYKAAVIDTLVSEILNGVIAPGTKLSENRLAQRYGTSRMPVREALIELNRRGMVRVVPQVGTFVIEITPERALAQFEVREALETQAVRLAAAQQDPQSLKMMEDVLGRMRIAVDAESLRGYVALDEEFHDIIFDSTGNIPLKEHYTMLRGALAREYVSLIVSTLQGRMARSLAEHIAVFEGIRSGDPAAAEEAMRAHVTVGKHELERAFSERSCASQKSPSPEPREHP